MRNVGNVREEDVHVEVKSRAAKAMSAVGTAQLARGYAMRSQFIG